MASPFRKIGGGLAAIVKRALGIERTEIVRTGLVQHQIADPAIPSGTSSSSLYVDPKGFLVCPFVLSGKVSCHANLLSGKENL